MDCELKNRWMLSVGIASLACLGGCRIDSKKDVDVRSKWIYPQVITNAVPNDVVACHRVRNESQVVTVAHVEPVFDVTLGQQTVQPAPAMAMPIENQPIESSQSIDLPTALLLTSGSHPQILNANARIEEALAQIDRAHALKLPSLRAGVNYNKHEGRIQDVAGSVIETSRGSFYHGIGANAVGAGSPAVPGIVSQFHFADAIFQPRIAQQTACARRAGAEALTNDALLATALAYMELLRAEQDLAIAVQVQDFAERLERTTFEFERVGEGLASDHDRARTELALRKSERIRAEELAEIASTRLAERIRWDSAQKLSPTEMQLVPMHLAEPNSDVRQLVATGLAQRPELSEARHLVMEATERLRRERQAPLVPSVLLAASYGGLGGGVGSDLENYGDRLDADAVAFWEIRQFGVGEKAIRREARARVSQARAQQMMAMDRVAREVVESHAQVTARARQIAVVEEAALAARDSYEKNWERIQNGEGLPIEVLQSLQALATARREYTRTVAEYNQAQFQLQRSLGWPIYGVESTND